MSSPISLDALLDESMLQQAARKLTKHIGHVPHKSAPKPTPESIAIAETAVMLRQWDAKREWAHNRNVLVFTRQKCKCCESSAATFDGMFIELKNNRLNNTFKMEPVIHFELDKPKAVVYRDSFVVICHECADIQQDWPLEEL